MIYALKCKTAGFSVAVLMCVVGLFVFSGCSSGDQSGTGGAKSAGPAEKTVTIGIQQNPSTLDPAYIVDVVSGKVAAKIFNGLVRYNSKLEIVPDIALSWDISEDGRTYTFKLRKEVYFSNGKKLTASDFVYSFKRILSPKVHSPKTWVLDKIKGAKLFAMGKSDAVEGIHCPDAYTLVIELEQPFGPFLHLLGMPAAYVVPEEEVEKLGREFAFKPVGTGPFVLESWQQDNAIVLAKNKKYFDLPARVFSIVYKIFPEEFALRTEFEAGNLDVIPLGRSLLRAFKNDMRYSKNIVSCQGANTYYVGFNCSRSPFDSARLRLSLNHAINREKIIDTILDGSATPAKGPVPGILDDYSDRLPAWTFVPGKTAQVVENVIPDCQTREFTFYISTNDEALSIAQVLQHYFKKVGLRVKIISREWSSFKKAVNEGQADMFLLSWWADYPSPENFLYPTFFSDNLGAAGNRARFVDSGFDGIVTKAQRTTSPVKLSLLYEKAEAYIMKKSPWIFLWHKNEYAVTQPYIKGYRLSPIYNMEKGTELEKF